jgi:hypothetical protein
MRKMRPYNTQGMPAESHCFPSVANEVRCHTYVSSCQNCWSKMAIAWLVSCTAGLTTLGCGPKLPPTAHVKGHVLFNGKPVIQGRMMFQPQSGRPAIGTIQTDGTYNLTTFKSDDGAILGKHSVTIEAFEAIDAPKPASFADELADKGRLASPKKVVRWFVPEKYAHPETSNLTAEVKLGENTIHFDLP